MNKLIKEGIAIKMNTYLLPIGDWSDDGHGQCEWFSVTTKKSLQDIFDAYYKAKELHPDIDPAEICHVYQDGRVDEDTLLKIKEMGFIHFEGLGPYIDAMDFALFVVWYINLGDKKLKLNFKPSLNDKLKIINWNDKSGKEFPSFGYGLFDG